MTNKPMLSVDRELLSTALKADASIGATATELVKGWVAMVELRALLDKDVLESQYDGMTQGQAQDVSDGVDEILHGKPAAQHHGDPVAWQYRVSAGPATGWSLWHDGKGEEFKNSYQVETRPLYAEQPAPASDHTQCEECKGWGYHENHHEGGGTECGECGGSGNATVAVAVVMPDRQIVPDNLMAGLTRKWCEGWNDALEEVARLNGVKP